LRVKPIGEMPYYVGHWESARYRNRKKLFALEQLTTSGLLDHLMELKAETVIIFGSFSRWDWYNESDIDLFIYGNADGLKPVQFESKLHREIQIFHAENKKDLKKYGVELLKNIVGGHFIKGNADFLNIHG